MSSEYTKPTVGATSCNYVTLKTYNDRPGLAPDTSSGFVPGSMVPVFPNFGTAGYDTLSHGQKNGSCSGYFGISAAYGSGANNCNTKYSHMLCDE